MVTYYVPVLLCKQNRGGGLDMNVTGAWQAGYRGKGVVVSILDDGIEKDHPDLVRNYVSEAFYYFCFNSIGSLKCRRCTI